MAESSRTDRHVSHKIQRGRSEGRDSNRYCSPSPGPRRTNNLSDFKKPYQHKSGTLPETATIRGLTLKFASQIFPKTTNETKVPVRSEAMKKMHIFWPKPNIPAVSVKHVSIVAKMAILGTNAVSEAKI